MTKENKKTLARVAEKLTEVRKEISHIAIEEATWGLNELPGSVDHAEMCLAMTIADSKIVYAMDLLKRALELAGHDMQAEKDPREDKKKRDQMNNVLEMANDFARKMKKRRR